MYIYTHIYIHTQCMIYVFIYIYIHVIDRKINRPCWENSQLLAVDLGNSQRSTHVAMHSGTGEYRESNKPGGHLQLSEALCKPLYNLCHKISPDAFHVPILRHYASRKKRGKALECSEGVNWCPLCQVCHDDTLDTLHTCLYPSSAPFNPEAFYENHTSIFLHVHRYLRKLNAEDCYFMRFLYVHVLPHELPMFC